MNEGSTQTVIMPALGMTQETGEIVAWHKQVGDAVKPDDVLMEVETDKTTMEIEAGFTGYVAEIRAAAGTSIEVGEIVAVLSESPVELPGEAPLDTSIETITEPVSESVTIDLTQNDSSQKDSSEFLAVTNQHVRSNDSSTTVAVSKASSAQQSLTTRSRQQAAVKTKEVQHLRRNSQQLNEDASVIVLASPKARLAAFEQGVSLTRMLRAGVPLPIQVADVNEFSLSEQANASSRSQLQARVPSDKFNDFANWLVEFSEGQSGRTAAWCTFGAAAIREAQNISAEEEVLIRCENWVNRDLDIQSINPDFVGLLDIVNVDSSFDPDLLIRDMTGTSLINYQPSEPEANTNLTIIEDGGSHFLFSLGFHEERLALSQALVLLETLEERTKQPLRHLL